MTMPDPVGITRATYDEVAPQYHRRNGGVFPGLDEELDDFCRPLPEGAQVVDLGCGPGRDLGLLQQRGLRAYGVDLSMGMLRTSGLTGVVRGDLRALPIRTGCLDGIWCQAALLHVPLAEVPGTLAEFIRVLRPGGVLHLSVAEGDGESWESHQYDKWPRWFTLYRPQPLRRLLVQAGFSIQKVRQQRLGRDWLVVEAIRSR
jgi:SAM-dependent methyltransferase